MRGTQLGGARRGRLPPRRARFWSQHGVEVLRKLKRWRAMLISSCTKVHPRLRPRCCSFASLRYARAPAGRVCALAVRWSRTEPFPASRFSPVFMVTAVKGRLPARSGRIFDARLARMCPRMGAHEKRLWSNPGSTQDYSAHKPTDSSPDAPAERRFSSSKSHLGPDTSRPARSARWPDSLRWPHIAQASRCFPAPFAHKPRGGGY